jgi:hypothetical protein
MSPTGIKVLIPSDAAASIEVELDAFDKFFISLQPGKIGMIGAERMLLKSYLAWKVKEAAAEAAPDGTAS